MKRKLLLFCSLLATSLVSTVKAQDFDLDFYKYFEANKAAYNKTTAKDAATAWRGAGSTVTPYLPGASITMNNISAYVLQNNRVNNISVNDDNTTTQNNVRMSFGNNDAKMMITSTVDLKTIALMYRGGTDTEAGAFKITYGADEGSIELDPKVYTFPNVTSGAPGQANFFNIPADAGSVRYVVIQRTGANSPRLYRIAASSTVFTTLPLEFLSFTAKTGLGNAVNLNWSTAKEVNTKEFIVERGTEAGDFKAIGSLSSSNTAGSHNYSFVDETAVAGKAYYRIKQVDNDGKFAYSDVVQISVKGGGVSLSAFPNPTSDFLTVSYAAAKSGSLKVVNAQGQSVINQALTTGATSSKLNVAALAAGIYYVVLANDGSQSSVKFVKN